MPSFQTTISPTRRAAARFIVAVRRALQQAYVEEYRKRGLTQSEIARAIKVHRSVINRELRGEADISLGRVGELAYVLGRKPLLALPPKQAKSGANTPVSAGSDSGSAFKIANDNNTVKTGANAPALEFAQ